MDGNWDNTDGVFDQIYGLLEQTFANPDTTVFMNNMIVSNWLAQVSIQITETKAQIQVFEEIIQIPGRSEEDKAYVMTFLQSLKERYEMLLRTAEELPNVRVFRIYYKSEIFFGPNILKQTFIEKLENEVNGSGIVSNLFFDVRIEKPYLLGNTNLYEITLVLIPSKDLKLPYDDDF